MDDSIRRRLEKRVSVEPIDMFSELTEEEKQQNKWYAEGYADAVRDMRKSCQSITWVPVKERMPSKAGHYLGCGRKGGIYLVKYLGDNSNMWWQAGHGSASVRVTAWSELPEPYMEDNDNQN